MPNAAPVRGGFPVASGASTGFAYEPVLKGQTLEGVRMFLSTTGRAQGQLSICDDNVAGLVLFELDEGEMAFDGTSVPRTLEWEGHWTNDSVKSVWVKFFAFNTTGNTALAVLYSLWVVP